jgi:hypothetical protein
MKGKVKNKSRNGARERDPALQAAIDRKVEQLKRRAMFYTDCTASTHCKVTTSTKQ